MPKIDIWMPWYIADYQADTSHLNPAQDSAYRRLLEHQWRTRRPLPNDVLALLEITKTTFFYVNAPSIPRACVEHAASMGRADASREDRLLYAWVLDLLQQFFVQREDGTWSQLRLEKELAAWTLKNETAAEHAAKAAWNRWHGPNSRDPQPWPGLTKSPDARSIAQDKPALSPSPSPLGTKANTNGSLRSPLRQSAGKAVGNTPADRTSTARSSSSAASAKGKKPTPEIASRTRSGIPATGKGASVPIDAASPPPKFGALDDKKAVRPPNTSQASDPRFRSFKEEIFAFYASVNERLISTGKLPKFPTWDVRASVALNALLSAHADFTLPMLQHSLLGRAGSATIQTEPPSWWLREILRYADGALDRYNRRVQPGRR